MAAAAVKKALVSFHQVETSSSAAPGRRVGPYTLMEEIGRGGMGTVYLAVREGVPSAKKVAIKIVRRGMDTDFILARFRRERQILAQLEHPNIARLIDGGASEDGLPYLVMEYVQGVAITHYAKQNQLSVDQRLRLFLQVCEAVECAHRNFVIHRDIKPGNIIVDGEGSPKLLDFGISKLLASDGSMATQTITQDVRMLTPDYASPEQVMGDPITAAADIYSLGAVLFELLTGAKPHRIEKTSPQAVERAICEQPIPKPSEVARAQGNLGLAKKLQGDLDNILLLAMRKEPKRRYASAHYFAEDIRRYLNHLPVSARPDTVMYRTKKFARRNWTVMAAVLAVILLLMTGVYVAEREARIAQTHFQQVRRLANTFVTSVHDEIKTLPGSTKARQVIVKTGLEYLESLAASAQGDIDLQRELGTGYMRIADVQGNVLESNLGDTTGALQNYNKALKLLEEVARVRPEALDVQTDILNIYRRVGDVYNYTKSADAALKAYAHARSVGEALLARTPGDEALQRSIADVYQAQGRTLRLTEDPSASIDACQRANGLYQALLANHPGDSSVRRELANTLSAQGMTLSRLGRREEAIDQFRESVRHYEMLVARDRPNVSMKRGLMLAYSHVGDFYSEPGVAKPSDLPSAQVAYQHMYDVAQELQADDKADRRAVFDLGIATMRLANVTPKPVQKLERYHEALGYLKRASGDREDLVALLNIAYIDTKIGELLLEGGLGVEAAKYFRESVPINEKLLITDPKNSSARRSLIVGLRALGEDAAKRKSTREAFEIRDKLVRVSDEVDKPDQPVRVQTLAAKGYASIGFIESLLGNKEAARKQFERSVALFRQLQSAPGFAAKQDLQEAEAGLAKLR